jgi:hypothetical protein
LHHPFVDFGHHLIWLEFLRDPDEFAGEAHFVGENDYVLAYNHDSEDEVENYTDPAKDCEAIAKAVHINNNYIFN